MKYKIIASKVQLVDIGIDYDITGLIGEMKKYYINRWLTLEVSYTVGETTVTNSFDIPRDLLIKVD